MSLFLYLRSSHNGLRLTQQWLFKSFKLGNVLPRAPLGYFGGSFLCGLPLDSSPLDRHWASVFLKDSVSAAPTTWRVFNRGIQFMRVIGRHLALHIHCGSYLTVNRVAAWPPFRLQAPVQLELPISQWELQW